MLSVSCQHLLECVLARFLRLTRKKAEAGAHFLVESDTPGALTERGLGYADVAAVNPALVYVSISPFGQDGPKAHYADSDLIILAASGVLVLSGDDDRPPVRVSVPQAYLHASAEAAVAALIAHHERQRSGRGQHVDISAQQAVLQTTFSNILAAPLGAPEYRRLSGGIKLGPLTLRLSGRRRTAMSRSPFSSARPSAHLPNG
jgi:crotonobetainyl-CoA:carnitine CoA-transferase CaiB-like acyl-CoA transferase